MTQWSVIVEEDPETGELVVPLPEGLITLKGWIEGDTIEWIDNGDGSWIIQKVHG